MEMVLSTIGEDVVIEFRVTVSTASESGPQFNKDASLRELSHHNTETNIAFHYSMLPPSPTGWHCQTGPEDRLLVL